jgi:hypothetical protein
MSDGSHYKTLRVREGHEVLRQLVECASPLALWHRTTSWFTTLVGVAFGKIYPAPTNDRKPE